MTGEWGERPAGGDPREASSDHTPPPAAQWTPPTVEHWSPPANEPPAYEAPAPPRKGRGRALFLVISLIAAAASFGFFVVKDDGPDYPDEWDPRVRDLVAFVEKERNLEFEHPVNIVFLDEDAWEREMTGGGELTAEQATEYEEFEQFNRALGFIDGDVDLAESAEEYASDGILAVYDFVNKEIVVNTAPSAKLTLSTRGTLVHELTHTLQDQNFDLSELYARAGERATGLTALVEGDATNTEAAWREQELSKKQRKKYDEQMEDLAAEFGDDVEIPSVLTTFYGAPYQLGPLFAEAVAREGRGRMNRAFTEIPNDEHAFDPVSFLTGDEAELVGRMRRPKGTKPIEDGEFGVLSWYLLLSERIDPHLALDAVLGWGGDQFVAYADNGKSCVDVRFRGEDRDAADKMALALQAWVNSLPTQFATYERDGGEDVTLHSCDPGTEIELTTGQSADAFALPLMRNYLVNIAMNAGQSPQDAGCIATKVVLESSVDELAAEEPSDAVLERAANAAATC